VGTNESVHLLQSLGGYTLSKLGSEVLCREAAAHGCDVTVFRPGICTSRSENGFCNNLDFYPRLLRAMVTERIYPAIPVDATFDMTPVDYVAHGINQIVLNSTVATTTSSYVNSTMEREISQTVRCYHPLSPHHEVGFHVLVAGVQLYLKQYQSVSLSDVPVLTQLPFSEFQQQMCQVESFASIQHELRSGGRPAVRKCDTTSWTVDLAKMDCTFLPDPEVTPAVVKKCIEFIFRK
jgi:thioester reductase-like protein